MSDQNVTDALTIRDLVEQELDALLALYAHLHADDTPAERGRAAVVWHAILADSAHLYLGAFVGGELVAACNAVIVPNLTRGCRPYALIENVVASAAHRRQGYGTAVLREAVQRCWSRGCYKVMLMSASGRAAAHEFYGAIGFDRHSKQAFVIKRPEGL